MKKMMVVLVALLFTLPLLAQESNTAQEKVNRKVARYLKEDRVKDLATYLQSLKTCPTKAVKVENIPSFCVVNAFRRNGQIADKDLNARIDPIHLQIQAGAGKEAYAVVDRVSIFKALEYGLREKYKALYHTSSVAFNKSKYVAFYKNYKNTWLKDDVKQLIKRYWAWSQLHTYDALGAATMNLMIFAREAKIPVKEFMVIPEEDMICDSFINEAWKVAIKENARDLFRTLKYHTMMYYFSEKTDMYEGSLNVIMPDYERRYFMLPLILIAGPDGTIPMDVKRGVTSVVHQCEEQVQSYQECSGYNEEEIAYAKRVCKRLKESAIEHKVYIKSAEELRAEAKSKAQEKLRQKAETPITSRHIHF